MNKKTEILAPAGSMDSLVAACRLGADAVYLGAGDFNARRNAENFDMKSLKTAIEYCHTRGVRVYITLNTLVGDDEFPDALSLIKCGCTYGADAFIIADLGIARVVRKLAPSMPMHASTQIAVSTAAGFRKLEELGFTRAVLPRELSFAEIEEIRNNTDIELEMFIHGAHCMSVSGQCYLSGMLGGRSGNRGLCAQPCRLPFGVSGGTGYDLSLKDLSLIEHLPKLAELGITSFKIEGRMKRPEYVAAAVAACKSALLGKQDDTLFSDLRAIFSRSGFTSGYFDSNLGRHMFGTRGHDDVTAAAPVLKKFQKMYEKENPCIPISITLKAELGKPLMASASTGRIRVFVTSEYKVQRAKKHATEVSTIRTQLKKCGGTPFDVKMTDIDIDENINIPLSELNNIRRSVLAHLEHKLCENHEKGIKDTAMALPSLLKPHAAKSTSKRLPMVIRISDIDKLPENIEYAQTAAFVIPLNSPQDKINRLKKLGIPFGIEIPRALYGKTTKLEKTIKEAKKFGASFAYVGTLDGILVAQKYDLPTLGGFTLNAYNSHSLCELEALNLTAVTVSSELKLSDAASLKGDIPRGICAYGSIPLMLTRNCPIKNGKSCKDCRQNSYLTDRKGIRFPVVCSEQNAGEVLNSRPIYLADKQEDFKNLDFILLYFTKEKKETVAHIIESYQNGNEPSGEFTRGLYYRGVD